MNYSHVFINSSCRMVPLADAPAAVMEVEARAFGFLLVDAARIRMDEHGRPCRRVGGWSYGHVQHGYICAGAGGLNSMRVLRIAA